MYLDERGYTVLKTIVNNPAITGKEVEASLQLSRKQLSYAIEKINDYLQDNGMPKIERLRTGKFIIPVAVIEQYQTEEITGDGTTYIYTDKERGLLIFLMLLCVREELSIYHFTSKLEISKNTFLTDLKKLEQRLEEYHLEVLYSRQEGYHLVGSEYAKREMMVTSIRGILKIPRGKETIMDICQISEEMMEQVEKQISMIEERLQVRFTDERLKELPLIMCLIIIRTQKGRILRETICNDPQVCRIVDLPVYYELETNNGNRDYRIQIGGHYMNYNTVYVGMDVHKESFTLCSCKYEDEKASHYQRTPASYKNVLRYLAFLRTIYGEDTRFVCGYEAGCLGYSLYHQLENFNVECVILAPTTMLEQRSKRRIKTDKRDAEIIARSLAQHNYSPVHIPTETDNQTKEFIRMRDDHKAELKKIKQQILSFCLRQGYQYDGSGNWTAKHVKWLRSLKPAGLYKEILDEYLLTYTILTDKLNRLDQRIEELASKEEYKESVSKLTCFLGIKTHTALSVIVEVGDFQRFVSARKFAGYLGLVPGQHSSGDDRNGLGITKAGNTHVRRLLVESAQSYTRGKIGYKSRVLRSRQAGNSPQVINYADRANERLRRRYYKMVLKDGKKYNIAKTAIARELACFIWGMMTDNIY